MTPTSRASSVPRSETQGSLRQDKCISVSCSVISNSLQPHGLYPATLLCPWGFSSKHTGLSCHSLLQGIFPTQESNPGLPHCRQILNHLSYQGSPDGTWGSQRVGLTLRNYHFHFCSISLHFGMFSPIKIFLPCSSDLRHTPLNYCLLIYPKCHSVKHSSQSMPPPIPRPCCVWSLTDLTSQHTPWRQHVHQKDHGSGHPTDPDSTPGATTR